MTVAFQSFARSPLGAFIKSPLGVRGGGEAGFDLLAWRSGSDSEMHYSGKKGAWSKGTIDNNTGFEQRHMRSFFGGLWREMWGDYNARQNDAVLTRVKNKSIGGSGFQFSRIVDIDGRLGMTYHPGSGTIPMFVYSDNNGDNWSTVNLRSVAENSMPAMPVLLKLASGRLISFSRNYHGITSPVGTNFFCEYSDDDGDTWTEVLVYNYASQNWDTRPAWAYVNPAGRIILVGAPYSSPGKKTFYSDDDGETWSDYDHNLPDFYAIDLSRLQVHQMNSGRIIISGSGFASQKIFRSFYSDDDGETFTEIGAGNYTTQLLQIENILYRFKHDTKTIERSTDEGANWTDYDEVSTMGTDKGIFLRSKYETKSFL